MGQFARGTQTILVLLDPLFVLTLHLPHFRAHFRGLCAKFHGPGSQIIHEAIENRLPILDGCHALTDCLLLCHRNRKPDLLDLVLIKRRRVTQRGRYEAERQLQNQYPKEKPRSGEERGF
jgi:hypothetical protein